jgi:phenylalanine-4-hydroxylase
MTRPMLCDRYGRVQGSGTLGLSDPSVRIEAPAMDEIRTAAGAGGSRVELPADHPGFSDASYRCRRDAIAAAATGYRSGQAIPEVCYTPEEDALWALVARELEVKHLRYACAEYLDAAARLDLPRIRVPQLREVSECIGELGGFRIEPVAGLVSTRRFYGSLGDRCFLATQYIRHHSVPFYTPEPDVVHELIGHCNTLASPVFADLYQQAGLASRRADSDVALEFFSRVWWFTLEFGVVYEGTELRTYGAGLLSSYGELDVFRDAEIREFDIGAMGTLDYDITRYQPVLFAASSFPRLVDDLTAFFTTYDNDAYRGWARI